MSAAEEQVTEELSLRDEIDAAVKAQVEPETPVVEAEPADKPEVVEGRKRDEQGRFIKAEESTEPEPAAEKPAEAKVAAEAQEKPAETVETAPEVALAPPNGWTAEAKGKWATLPEEVQQAVLKREEDVHKQITKHDDARNFGTEIQRIVGPYMPQIQAEGGTASTAIQTLLNTAYILRTGSPEQKKDLLLRTAKQYGVDLGTQQIDPKTGEIPPYIKSVQTELQNLRQTLQQKDQAESQRLHAEIDNEISAFAADPAHPYYETVRGHMAALLSNNLAKDLQDAYDQACHARPDIRATLEATKAAAEEQKRKAEAKRKAEEAKRKNVSLTGSPGNTAGGTAPEGRGLREELAANMAASGGAGV